MRDYFKELDYGKIKRKCNRCLVGRDEVRVGDMA